MDNVAHALVGAAVGRAVGGGRVPQAGLLGAIAANAPDWTEVFTGWPWPRAQYLANHRGVTHALAGVAVETIALTIVFGFVARLLARRRGLPPPGLGVVLGLVGASVATHPLMDWQGSYGWRPLLPWNDRWYYGDFVAIVDAFYWLIPMIALAWTSRRHWLPLSGWGLLWALTTAAVLLTDAAASWVKASWIMISLVGIVGWVAHWVGPAGIRFAGAVTVGFLTLWSGAQAVASIPVKAATRRAAVARFGAQATWATLTLAGRPFAWEPMFAGRDTVAGTRWALPRHLEHPVVRRALRETRDGRDIARFARFLAASVDSSSTPPRVLLQDLRYTRAGGNGWATVTVVAP
jgi:inner membrane protein